MATLLRSALALSAALAALHAAAAPADFTGRGVFAFRSGSGCPFGALAAGDGCNRLALDDPGMRATVDEATHTIRFESQDDADARRIVGDVLLQGSGRAADGRRVPLSFHALLSRSGSGWSISSHAHAPERGDFDDIRIDPYRIVAGEAGQERVLLAPGQVAETLSKPSLAARLADEIVQVRDNRATAATGDADISIGLGVPKAAKWVARAHLRTPGAPGSSDAAGRSLADTMARGDWSLELQALSGQIPRQVVQRDLFLYGLESQSLLQPLLQPLLQRGFRKNEKLVLGASGGKGFLRYDGQQREFAEADAAARGFLQGSFIGLVLGWQQQQRSQMQPASIKARAHGG